MSPLRALSLLAPPLCTGCGRHARRAAALCTACRASLRWLGPQLLAAPGFELWAPVAYEGAAAALVRGLKFRGALVLADVMASQIAANAPPGALVSPPDGVLVPVPLHRARRERRGFNQAERIAAALGARTGLEVRDCLERGGSRDTQMGRDREQRRRIGGAVRLRRGAEAPAVVTLVDDVATTAATLSACARALKEGGTGVLTAVTYARTPGR